MRSSCSANRRRRVATGARAGALALGLCAVALALPGDAAAQALTSCGGIERDGSAKVVLSHIGVQATGGAAGPAPDALAELFYLSVEGKLEGVPIVARRSLQPDPRMPVQRRPPKVVQCANRKPKIDGTDFTASVIDMLNARNVLVEVWGGVVTSASDTSPRTDAWLAYTVIPVRLDPGRPEELGFRRVRYRLNSDDPLHDVLNEFEQGSELEVYTALAYGAKQLKDRGYDDAKHAFCIARISHRKTMGPATGPDADADAVALLGAIDGWIDETVTAAVQDSNYDGALKHPELVGDARACPED